MPVARADTARPSVSLRQLVEIRIIDSLTLSPDGRRLAYRVINRSVAKNAVSVRWYVVALDGSSRPIMFGRPSQPLWEPMFDFVDQADAQWDRTSTCLYVRTVGADGAIAIHRLAMAGREVVIAHDRGDIVSFHLTDQARRIVYEATAPREEQAHLLEEERQRGVRLDRSLVTDGMRLTGNFRIGNRVTTIRQLDADMFGIPFGRPHHQGTVMIDRPRPAGGSGERKGHDGPAREIGDMSTALQEMPPVMPIPGGRSLVLRPVGGTDYRLVEERAGGDRTCNTSFCTGRADQLRLAGFEPPTNEAILLHEAGSTHRTIVSGWDVTTGAARTIYDRGTSLNGGGEIGHSACVTASGALACVEAGAVSPPQLIRIDLRTGDRHILDDPNGSLRQAAYPRTETLSWTFADGRTADGLLVYPAVAAQSGHRVPLVITSYDCRGFLRGGVGQVAPEFLLAERGIAALCVNTDWSNLTRPPLTAGDTLLGIHKAMIASYAAAIRLLDHRGLIDPARVGVAGHSLSAVVTAYAISHTNLFAAAVTGTGVTIDPSSPYLTAPTADSWRRAVFSVLGLPDDGSDPSRLWEQVSPSLNASKIRAPLLLQPPEDEYLLGLQLVSAVQRAGGIAEAYIFPDAAHMVGREPAQQYARQLRSIDWFAFWLGGDAGTGAQSLTDTRSWEKWRPVAAMLSARK